MRGTSSDSLISYAGASDKTVAGNYAITITQLATRASLTASQAAGLTIVAGVNDQLDISVDGVAASVTLAAGTYGSTDSLAAEVQSKLNGAAALTTAGISVAGFAVRRHAEYYLNPVWLQLQNWPQRRQWREQPHGSSPRHTAGVDVAGNINGVTAIGSGQILTAAAVQPAEGFVLPSMADRLVHAEQSISHAAMPTS